jgi:hypothetical protein
MLFQQIYKNFKPPQTISRLEFSAFMLKEVDLRQVIKKALNLSQTTDDGEVNRLPLERLSQTGDSLG